MKINYTEIIFGVCILYLLAKDFWRGRNLKQFFIAYYTNKARTQKAIKKLEWDTNGIFIELDNLKADAGDFDDGE